MQVTVDQARQHTPALEVDDPGPLAGELHHVMVVPDRREFAVRDRDGGGGRIGTIECREQAAMEDDVRSMDRCIHEDVSGNLAAVVSD
jgi:hypothetical protein